jgi:biopolymer transport protein TolQ
MQAFTVAYHESDVFGKLIILSLVLLSIVCWVVLIYKVWQTRKVKQLSLSFHSEMTKHAEHLLALDVKHLPKPSSDKIPHPYGFIFEETKGKTLEILNKKMFFLGQKESSSSHPPVYLSSVDLELLENHAYVAISKQNKILEKDLFILSTIVTLAPFLGLLGTVWGILVTFSELQGGGSVGSNSTIIGGLSTALSTTVLGLVIAIPALVGYNYLKNGIKSLSSDMEHFLQGLLATLELQYRKVDI